MDQKKRRTWTLFTQWVLVFLIFFFILVETRNAKQENIEDIKLSKNLRQMHQLCFFMWYSVSRNVNKQKLRLKVKLVIYVYLEVYFLRRSSHFTAWNYCRRRDPSLIITFFKFFQNIVFEKTSDRMLLL